MTMTPTESKRTRLSRGRGMTPAEVLVHSLCDGKRTKDEIFKEVIGEIKGAGNPQEEFAQCLAALKKRGLVIF